MAQLEAEGPDESNLFLRAGAFDGAGQLPDNLRAVAGGGSQGRTGTGSTRESCP